LAGLGQQLHLKTRDIYNPPERAAAAEPRAPARDSKPFHQIIQFDHAPGAEDLDGLLAAGFRIVAAIPDNALVVIDTTAETGSKARVSQFGVKWMGELAPEDKISPALAIPVSGPILAIVEFHADVEKTTQQAIAAAEGLTVLRPAGLLPGHVIVNAPPAALGRLAARDEVAYIFPAAPGLLEPPQTGKAVMACGGLLTLAGPIAQYASAVDGWSLDSGAAAHLGYAFGALTLNVPKVTVESEIVRAMNTWSGVTNVFFSPALSATSARTIAIKFASGAHGDAWPFDNAGQILAHTFYPVPLNAESIAGDIHLDANVNWRAGGDIDIYSVVLHELGHAIGLVHSDKPGDVMYPYYQRGMQLSPNDIAAVRALYGAPEDRVPAVTAAPAVLSLILDPIAPPGSAAETTIGGTVSGGVPPLAMQYQTDLGYSGKIATVADGAWSAPDVPLATGVNTLTVTAFDAANHSASESAVITREAETGGTPPISVHISTPSGAVVTINGATASLGGTSSGGTGVTQVTWQTSNGAAGTAIGTSQWMASGVPLLVGSNAIIVRAFDAAGTSAWASLVVVRP
jgi:hypothetical protein